MVNYNAAFALGFSDKWKIAAGSVLYLLAGIISLLVMLPFNFMSEFLQMPALSVITWALFMFIMAVPVTYALIAGFTGKLPSWQETFSLCWKAGIVIIAYAMLLYVISNAAGYLIFGQEGYDFMQSNDLSANEGALPSEVIAKVPLFIAMQFLIYAVWWLLAATALFTFMEGRKISHGFDLLRIARRFSMPYIIHLILAFLIGAAFVAGMLVVGTILLASVIGVFLMPFVILPGIYLMSICVFSIAGQAYHGKDKK